MNAVARLSQRLQDYTRSEVLAIAKRAGICPTIGIRARRGSSITATPYMLLCTAVGLDPTSGQSNASVPRASGAIHWLTLASALLLTRAAWKLDLRTTARLVGVSIATLSR